MIGDGEVVQAGRLRGARHRLDVVAAVRLRGVAVQVAAEVRERTSRGSVPRRPLRSRRGSRAAPADRRETERRVDALFVVAGDARVVVDAKEPVLVQLEAALDGAIAQRDVVGLRAGEVLQRGAEALARDEPQVGLEAAPEQHARLGFAVGEHPLDELVAGEGLHERAGRAGREDVEVAAGLAAAPQAADHRDLGVGACSRARRRGRGVSEASAISRRPVNRRCSSSALRICASFFAPIPSSRGCGRRGGLLELVEAC